METSSEYVVLHMRLRFDTVGRGSPRANDPAILIKRESGQVERIRVSQIIEALGTAVLLDVGLDEDGTDSTAVEFAGEPCLEEALPPHTLDALYRQLEAPEGLTIRPPSSGSRDR